MESAFRYPAYVWQSPDARHGSPCVAGTSTRVCYVGDWYERQGWTPQAISEQLGVPLADVFGALAFYFDNKDASEAEECAREAWAEAQQRGEQVPFPVSLPV